jgi:transposase
MMGHRQVEQAALFYEFSLERHIPGDDLLRSIDRFVELGDLRRDLASFYSAMGRPSVDPELMIRMLIVGYCFGIRSERRLCEEVHLNLAYRWFCRLGLDGGVPDHSTFSKNRHGRFRQSDLLRRLFETILRRCIKEGLVGGEGFAVDASLIKAEASRQKGIEGVKGLPPEATGRAVQEYLAVLDDAAFGAATEVTPKFISPADPAARWTGAHGGQAFFAYSTNYLIDVDNAIIVDVEATTAIRQAEVLAAKRMIERSAGEVDTATQTKTSLTADCVAELTGRQARELSRIRPNAGLLQQNRPSTAARFQSRWESCSFGNLLFGTQAVAEGVDRVHHLCAIGRDVEAGAVIFIILAKKLGVELLNARRSDHSRAARRRVAMMLTQMQR